MKGYDVCINVLSAAGVETVFTLLSEDTMGMIARMDSEWAEDLSVLEVRHEQNAVSMADAYPAQRAGSAFAWSVGGHTRPDGDGSRQHERRSRICWYSRSSRRWTVRPNRNSSTRPVTPGPRSAR